MLLLYLLVHYLFNRYLNLIEHCSVVNSTPTLHFGSGTDLLPQPRAQVMLRLLLISSLSPGKYWDSTLKQAMVVSFHIFSNSFTYHSSQGLLDCDTA